MTQSWQDRYVDVTMKTELVIAVIIFAVVLGALFFLDVPADWRTPIVVAIAAIYIVVQVGTGSQSICAQVNISTEHALNTIMVSAGTTVDQDDDW